jgi:Fe-S-cluster containining protein
MREAARWRDHPARADLLAIFREADALVAGASCVCESPACAADARCCQFAVTGREPYPNPVELCEVAHGRRARGDDPARPRGKLRMLGGEGACPLLSSEGRCTIYASRPFGCRTFFCAGHEPPRRSRDAIQALSRRLSDLAARWFPRDPGPRPFTNALDGPPPVVPHLAHLRSTAAPSRPGGGSSR